jgi:hypothetical protein
MVAVVEAAVMVAALGNAASAKPAVSAMEAAACAMEAAASAVEAAASAVDAAVSAVEAAASAVKPAASAVEAAASTTMEAAASATVGPSAAAMPLGRGGCGNRRHGRRQQSRACKCGKNRFHLELHQGLMVTRANGRGLEVVVRLALHYAGRREHFSWFLRRVSGGPTCFRPDIGRRGYSSKTPTCVFRITAVIGPAAASESGLRICDRETRRR